MKPVTSIYNFLTKNRYLLPLGIALLTLIMLLLTLLPSDFMGQNKLWSYDKLGHMALFGSWSFAVGLYYQISYPSANLWPIFASGVFLVC
ncbi:MAG: hypothetical protein U5J63_15440 [Fodinibius sp.]|nr:hypothetical protein [Fodinibius sp.]